MDLEVFSDPDLLAEHLALIAKAGSSELAGDEDHARNKVRARDKYLRDERARQDFAGLVIRMQKTGVHEKVGYQSAVAFLFDKGHKWPGGGVPSERTLNYYLISARNLPSELVRQCLISIKGYAAAAGVPSELCRTALCQAIEAGATTKSIEGGARAARKALQKGGSEKRARAAAADEVNREPVTREERTAVAVAQAIRVLDRGRKGEGKAPRPTAEPETSHEIGRLKEGLAGLQQSVEMLVERIQTQGGMPAAQNPAVPEDPRRYPRNDPAEPAPPVVPDAGPAAQTTATPATEMPTEKAARTRSQNPSWSRFQTRSRPPRNRFRTCLKMRNPTRTMNLTKTTTPAATKTPPRPSRPLSRCPTAPRRSTWPSATPARTTSPPRASAAPARSSPPWRAPSA